MRRCVVGFRYTHHRHSETAKDERAEFGECAQGAAAAAVADAAVAFVVTDVDAVVATSPLPCTASTLSSRIHQAFEALRSNRSCSAELLANPRPITACNRVAITCVLDDVHRLQTQAASNTQLHTASAPVHKSVVFDMCIGPHLECQ